MSPFPAWYGYQPGGQITHSTHRTEPLSRKLRLLREGGRVRLFTIRPDRWAGLDVGEDAR